LAVFPGKAAGKSLSQLPDPGSAGGHQLWDRVHIRGVCDATWSTEPFGYGRKMYLLTATWDAKMSDNKVIPFRRREPKPSEIELEMFRHMTRNWSDQMRQLMFPLHSATDTKPGQRNPE
jgi:hypothetical protein